MRAAILALVAVLTATSAVTGPREAAPLWQVRAPADTSAESLARKAIAEYYEILNNAARYRAGFATGGMGPMPSARPEVCRGSTLKECFGGDMHCAWWGRMCDATFHALDRAALIARLQALQARFPDSEFVVGHLVNFALKDGDAVRALDAAEGCRAAEWWCQALRGYAMHAMLPGSGDLRFDSALANAPENALAFGFDVDPIVPDRGLHCEWRHAGHLWPNGLPEDWQAGECGARPELNKRFWWLADPLWSTPGNERRGEHISRNLAARFMYDHGWHEMPPAQARVWWWAPFNLHAEWTRNGFYNSWRTIVRTHQARPDTTHQLYVHGGYSFGPDADRFLRPETSTAEDWAVAWDEGPERMQWDATWHAISDHQTAVLRRGESLVAIAAARLPVLVGSFDRVQAALAMGRPSDLALERASANIDATGIMRARLPIPLGAWVASIEAYGSEWVGRTRFGAPAPPLEEGVGISAPLLVDPSFEPQSDSLDQALLPSTSLTLGRVGVYFELYGMEEDEVLEVTVSVERTDRSLLGRIGGFLGLSQVSSLSVAWTDVTERPQGQGYLPRFTEVDLSSLDAGRYRLGIGVAGDHGWTVSTAVSVSLRANP